jgi:hypothetical protein
MKKALFLGAFAVAIALYACKKDNKTTPDTPAGPDSTYLSDRKTIADKIKVAYGTKIQGNIPAATGSEDAPTLASEREDTIQAMNSRYIVVIPYHEEASKYAIKGYYLKINGTDSYFKVDYTQARGFRQAPKKTLGLREGDFIDSAIVVKLPDNVVSDTISFTYAAFDSLNNVSNHVNVTARVQSNGNNTDNKAFFGNWKATSITGEGETQEIGKPDSAFGFYHCVDGKIDGCTGTSGCFQIADAISERHLELTFSDDKNGYRQVSGSISSWLDFTKTVCDNIVYRTEEYTSSLAGGFYYDAVSKNIYVITDNDGYSQEFLYIGIMPIPVEEITATTLKITIDGAQITLKK